MILSVIFLLGLACVLRAEDVVPFTKLIPFLPKAPTGWMVAERADEPEGSTAAVGGYKISTVDRNYSKEVEGEVSTARIAITDMAGTKGAREAVVAGWKMTADADSDHSKAVTVDGCPGLETSDKDSRDASVALLVGKRFIVEIELTKVEPVVLQKWVKAINLKQLAELK